VYVIGIKLAPPITAARWSLVQNLGPKLGDVWVGMSAILRKAY
jgi:hypothetical protein